MLLCQVKDGHFKYMLNIKPKKGRYLIFIIIYTTNNNQNNNNINKLKRHFGPKS